MSLRQELAVILMDHVDGMRDDTYKNILESLGKIPDHKDPTSALELQKELKRQQSEYQLLEDNLFDCQDQLEGQEHFIRSASHSITMMSYRIHVLENAFRLERHRNLDLHNRVLNYQKLVKVPKAVCDGRGLYSITDIPTGVYFATDQLERSSLKAVQDMFNKYERLHRDRERADRVHWLNRNSNKTMEIYRSQLEIDNLTRGLSVVKPFYLFMREGKALSNEKVSLKEWGRRWREEVSDEVRRDIVERSKKMYRVSYPYNKSKRDPGPYLHFPEKDMVFRGALGVMEQIRFDIDRMGESINQEQAEEELRQCRIKVNGLLSKIRSLQESIDRDRLVQHL